MPLEIIKVGETRWKVLHEKNRHDAMCAIASALSSGVSSYRLIRDKMRAGEGPEIVAEVVQIFEDSSSPDDGKTSNSLPLSRI